MQTEAQNGEQEASAVTALEGYVSKEQLAEQLGKSARALDRWESLRIGPPRTYVGKTPMYRLESVREWLEGQERPNRRSR